MKRFTRSALLVSLFVLLFGCASGSNRKAAEGTDLHPRLSDSAYIEKGDLLTFIVDTGIAYGRNDGKIFALEIGLANTGMESLTLTRESFTLIDESGNQYTSLTKAALEDLNYNRDTDRRLARLLPVLAARWISYTPLRSNFSPGFFVPFEREEVFLARYTWIYDTLYFENPYDDLRGKRFELLLSARELENDIVLKFRIPR